MLKKVTLAIILGAFASAAASAQTLKIGVVDAEVVIRGSQEGKALITKLEKFQGTKQGEIDRVTKEVTDLRNKLQTQQLTLNDEARAKMERDVEQKTVALRRLQEDAQAELDDMKELGLKTINEKVLPIIEKFSADNGFSIVFDRNRSGIIVSSPTLDVSNDIIKLLDQQTAAAPAAQPK